MLFRSSTFDRKRECLGCGGTFMLRRNERRPICLSCRRKKDVFQQAVYRYNSSFGGATSVVKGLSNPADIYYNTLTDTLAVPNAGNNTVTFYYFGSPASVDELTADAGVRIFPNPVKDVAVIDYYLAAAAQVHLSVFNAEGKLVKVLVNELQPAGKQSVEFIRRDLAGGEYFYSLQAGSKTYSGKITLAGQQ